MTGLFKIDRQNIFFKKLSKSFPKPVDKSPLNVLAIRGTFFHIKKTTSGPDVFYGLATIPTGMTLEPMTLYPYFVDAA